jgi:polyribonucleotide nucleotidyltransferase
LAQRALEAVLPSIEDFPYAIRSVTEIMSQNGSTSMAATCSSCLALMDAGVPISAPVSGIAMGLMMDGETPYVLSDIADAEDFAGAEIGTPASIRAKQLEQVAAIEVEPFCDMISVTLRIAYGKSSIEGNTASSARWAN